MKRKDLEKLKKDELIEIVLEQQHLAEAVKAKDLEISKLKEKHELEIDIRVSAKIEAVEKQLADKHKEIDGIKTQYDSDIRNLVEELERRDTFLKSLGASVSDILERYHSLLKIMQGTVDSHIELHGLSTNTINSFFENTGGD